MEGTDAPGETAPLLAPPPPVSASGVLEGVPLTPTVYLGTFGYAVAVDPQSGSEKWRTGLPGSMYDIGPMIVEGSKLFVASSGRAYAIDAATGVLLWTNDLKGLGLSVMTITSNVAEAPHTAAGAAHTPLLFVGTAGYVVCLRQEDGVELWRTSLPKTGYTVVTIHFDGFLSTLFVGCFGHLFRLNVRDGVIQWHNELAGYGLGPICMDLPPVPPPSTTTNDLPSQVPCSPLPAAAATAIPEAIATVSKRRLIIGTSGYVAAFDVATGAEVWCLTVPGSWCMTTNVAWCPFDESLVIVGSSGKIFGVHAHLGKILWENPLEAMKLGCVTITFVPPPASASSSAAPPSLVVGTGGWVACLECGLGKEQWRTSLPGTLYSMVTVLSDATLGVVLAGSNGKLFRLDPATGTILWCNGLPNLCYGKLCIATPFASACSSRDPVPQIQIMLEER